MECQTATSAHGMVWDHCSHLCDILNDGLCLLAVMTHHPPAPPLSLPPSTCLHVMDVTWAGVICLICIHEPEGCLICIHKPEGYICCLGFMYSQARVREYISGKSTCPCYIHNIWVCGGRGSLGQTSGECGPQVCTYISGKSPRSCYIHNM